jgi:peptidoglycan hydrolase-like protein with peptidoglycan-binding domain
LNCLNWDTMKESSTGLYDSKTFEAVKKFQKANGLEPDGVFGLKTANALSKYYTAPVIYAPNEPPPGEIMILVDIEERKLTVISDGKPYKQYPVAAGKYETPTPIGNFRITQKAIWSGGFGSRWMRLSVPWGAYGIHGTDKPYSIGSYASSGCIRMHNRHVEELYSWVKIDTPVKIIGGLYGPFMQGFRTLVRGEKGAEVYEVQKRLKGFGFYDGEIDGNFGYGTEAAVKAFQREYKLPVTGQVTKAVYEKLGFVLFE